jgi:hypothetical protein
VCCFAIEICESRDVSRFSSSSWCVDDIFEAVCVSEELGILDVVILVTVDKGDSIDLLLADLESEGVENLTEDLGGDLERAKSISILEEALCVEAIAANDFTEVINNVGDKCTLLGIGLTTTINCGSAARTNSSVSVPLQTLAGEDFIDLIREFSPFDVLTLLRCLEHLAEKLELTGRDRGLGHGKSNAELSSRDKAGSKAIEISEELSDADALLLALGADASDNIFVVIRGVADDLGLASASLSLGVVVGAVVEALANTEELVATINVLKKST